MFKNKLFLTGLGIGLIVGAILLEIMTYANNPLPEQGNVVEETMEEAELVEAVEKLGYRVIKTDLTSTPAPQANMDKETPVPTLAPTPTSETTLSPSLSPSPSASPTATVVPTPATSSPSKGVTVTIPRGSGSGAVGDLLFRSKVISDVDEFKKLVESRKLTNKIQPGTFSFTGTETLDEVIRVITTVQ